MAAITHELALHGGPKAVHDVLPTFLDKSGRRFGAEEETMVLEALRSGCLSRNGGTMVKRFEQEFAARLGTTHAVACSSGSAAIHLAVASLDPEPGDEFIVPPITDIGSIFPVLWQNCVPVFADIDPLTMNIDPADVERKITKHTRAIIAVHLTGQPCELHRLRQIADRHRLVLIEDCAQAYWAEYDGHLVGTVGDIGCFSLQQSKHITCGEGGVMVTSNSVIAQRARLFADKAWPRDTGGLGSARFLFLPQNYRMTELQGAVSIAQLQKLSSILVSRRARAEHLSKLIHGTPGVQSPTIPTNTRHSWWLYMLRVDEKALDVSTQTFGDALVAEGVHAWVRYIVEPIYCSPLFTQKKTYGSSGFPFTTWETQEFRKGLCPKAEEALSGCIAVHWNENYTESHVEQIASAIKKVSSHFVMS